mmetsp:Transcript_5941/g.17496  ORF Transcript_5941/g.17496 Transcript_5941/m.17496 type:complete len:224 (+) Transcript_5941:1039-1710(+)
MFEASPKYKPVDLSYTNPSGEVVDFRSSEHIFSISILSPPEPMLFPWDSQQRLSSLIEKVFGSTLTFTSAVDGTAGVGSFFASFSSVLSSLSESANMSSSASSYVVFASNFKTKFADFSNICFSMVYAPYSPAVTNLDAIAVILSNIFLFSPSNLEFFCRCCSFVPFLLSFFDFCFDTYLFLLLLPGPSLAPPTLLIAFKAVSVGPSSNSANCLFNFATPSSV